MPKFKTVLITGASSGIGKEVAKSFAKESEKLILVARRKERLEALKAELSCEVDMIDCDINNISLLREKLSGLTSSLDVLVNNAGLAKGVLGVDENSDEDINMMLDTNVRALLLLTKTFIPDLKRNKGHIINLGSVAGKYVYPGGTVYCASKFAVRAFSEGLRLDLNGTGVRVTNIEPGMVETEFSNVRLEDENKARDVYKGMTPLSPVDIAETILWSATRPAHVNIQELMIYPTDQAGVGYVHRT